MFVFKPIMIHPQALESSASSVAMVSWRGCTQFSFIGTKVSKWLLSRQAMVCAKVGFGKLMLSIPIKFFSSYICLKLFLTSQYSDSFF